MYLGMARGDMNWCHGVNAEDSGDGVSAVLYKPAPGVGATTCKWSVGTVPECRSIASAGERKRMTMIIINTAVFIATEQYQ